MGDPILMFPRVVIRFNDPTSSDNKDEGFIDGNIWINKLTSTIFLCVNAMNGTWVTLLASGSAVGGGNLSFGDGTNSNIDFNLGSGHFILDSDNIDVDEDGTLHLKGGQIEFYYERIGDPDASEFAIVKVERGDQPDAYIKWNEQLDAWMSGIEDKMYPIATVVTETRNPLDSDYEGYFIGQTWVNLVTQQKFTCMSLDSTTQTAKWRLALTTAPTKYMVEYDDYLVLYGSTDNTFMKISVDNFASWIQDKIGGLGTPTAGYGWVLDASDNIAVSDVEPITTGLFEEDGNGDLQPSTTTSGDLYFELDANSDITPVDETPAPS